MKAFLGLISILLITTSCDALHKNNALSEEHPSSDTDFHSYANLNEISTKHLHLELDVNFDNETIYGVARHEMNNRGADTAVFDINGLMIQKVTIGEKGSEEEADMFIDKMESACCCPGFPIFSLSYSWYNWILSIADLGRF